jgi:hypothetical protein
MQWRFLAVVAAALFLLTVLIRAPASWALKLAPAGVDCAVPAGSMWRGSCARMSVAGIELQGVDWNVHAWALLRAHLDLDLSSADPRAPGTVLLSISPGGHLVLRQLHAQLPVGTDFLPLFPTAWRGRLRLEFPRVEFEDHRLRVLEGTATASDLAQRSPPILYGSYELQFAPLPGAMAPSREPAIWAVRWRFRHAACRAAAAPTNSMAWSTQDPGPVPIW